VKSIAEAGGTAVAEVVAVGTSEAAQALVDRAVNEFGRLDILVNNAGLVLRQRFVDTTPEDWRKQIDVCLYGAIHCCHAAVPYMIEQNGGRIVSLAGDSSRIGESGLAIGGAARAGVIVLMKSLAKELGRSNITANAVALGLVETSHTDKEWLDANREKITRLYPLRRLGQADDVAPLIAFLASDAASWITGQVMSVNGGFSTAG
jgi:2-hydroxycyclohexanecarboxyl-CoA dehydrogenase